MATSNSLLENMRSERHVYEAVYMQFANCTKLHYSHAFCFYEGEDGKYYDHRIRNYFDDKFLTYKVENKKGVLRLINKIRESKLYDNVCTMFFVDRDFDRLEDKDRDLFETPCYSIENLYAQEECIKRILQSEFGLNINDPDFNKCVCDFLGREKEFNNVIMEFNALAYLRRKRSDSNSDFSFGSVKTSHIACVSAFAVKKATQYVTTIDAIKQVLQFDEEELLKAEEDLSKYGQLSLLLRGKNQLDFFVSFINCIKQLNIDGGYFSKRYNCVSINITKNRLSELSQYAITPPELRVFLESHKAKFENVAI